MTHCDMIQSWLNSTDRVGVEDLITYLLQTDFFSAPCSTKHHLSNPGGLAEHSLNVLNILMDLGKKYKWFKTRNASIIICGLMHDLCKANYYREDHDATPTRYLIDDQHPYGHGEASVILLQQHISLEPEEICAIRWHMGAWTPGLLTDQNMLRAFNQACAKYPLVPALISADYEATQLLERD